ncbi:MAG TPA: HAMP domain-containing sensor histidine kinase [Clostridia bacterium]
MVGIVFGLLAQYYAEKQSRDQLVKDANAILDVLIKDKSKNEDITSPPSKQAVRKSVFGQVGNMESNFYLVSKELKIMYPRTDKVEQFKKRVLPQISEKLNPKTLESATMKIKIADQENIVAIIPPRSDVDQSLRGWVVLYTPVAPVQKLIKSMLSVLLVSLLVSAVIAAFAGVLVARTIAKPIILLKDRAKSIAKREYDGKADINTGDELEELGDTINFMSLELKVYDMAQKRFFQNASHELKTPLMSIQGYAEGLKDGVFENNDEAFDIIIDESKRLKGIVDGLIFLSKNETQDDFYKFSNESINEVIRNSIDKIKGLSSKNKINISVALGKDAKLAIDRDKITQAVINVLGNCIRYAKSEIKVITSNDGKSFEITIQDDGEGFSGDEINKIFERFYKGKNGNSGLGLAITKAIIEKHKGFILASNSTGGGAEFKIRLPINNN